MARRDGRLSAMRVNLASCEEELVLLRSSKELLAARHELQVELNRQRSLVSNEEVALQRAVAHVKTRQLDARDELVRAVGIRASAALDALREAGADAAASEQSTKERWSFQVGHLEATQLRNEAATFELEGRLHAARLEFERLEERGNKMAEERNEAKVLAGVRARERDEACEKAFHNHVLLIKLLLSTRKSPENVLVQELYEELSAKEIPVQEWPNWLMMRMSGGDSLSSWRLSEPRVRHVPQGTEHRAPPGLTRIRHRIGLFETGRFLL